LVGYPSYRTSVAIPANHAETLEPLDTNPADPNYPALALEGFRLLTA